MRSFCFGTPRATGWSFASATWKPVSAFGAVAPGSASDAFHHPYAYAARHESSYRVDRAETAIIAG
jgi:hypothetical protein